MSRINVKVTDRGENAILAIKVAREITGLGLKEAKDFVDGTSTLTVTESDAEALTKGLGEVGAKVTLAEKSTSESNYDVLSVRSKQQNDIGPPRGFFQKIAGLFQGK